MSMNYELRILRSNMATKALILVVRAFAWVVDYIRDHVVYYIITYGLSLQPGNNCHTQL